MAFQNDRNHGAGEAVQRSLAETIEAAEPRSGSSGADPQREHHVINCSNKGKQPERCTRRPTSAVGGVREGHIGRRGWVQEEDERLREVGKLAQSGGGLHRMIEGLTRACTLEVAWGSFVKIE